MKTTKDGMIETKKRNKGMGRAETAGVRMADAIVEFVHLMYQKQTALRVLIALESRIKERMGDFV